jgi:hypothetical protein
MNRIVQIFLFSAVLAGTVNAETMEERKVRLTRKYLHERQEIVQSAVVLFDDKENEQVLDSEKFQQGQKDFSQQQGSSLGRPVVVQASSARSSQQGSWLLSEDDALTDPYADPFADPFSMDDETGQSSDERESRWGQWQRQQEQMAARPQATADAAGSSYSGRGEYSAVYGDAGQQDRSSRYTTYGQQQGTSYGGGASYGQQQSGYSLYGTTRSGSSSSSSSMLRYPGSSTQDSGTSSSSSTRSYTPYTSSYQSQQVQPSAQQQSSQQQQEFIRTSPFQKWKSNQQSRDDHVNDQMK